MMNTLPHLLLITTILATVVHFARRRLVAHYTVRWIFMLGHYDHYNTIHNEDVERGYMLINYMKEVSSWWKWTQRSIVADKELFDQVYSYYRTHPPWNYYR